MRAGSAAGERERKRFTREAEAMRELGVPGVVRVLEIGETPQGMPWFAMERVDGRDLGSILDDGPGLEPEHMHRMALSLTRTLWQVHRAGIVHRDIKPGNVLIDREGRALLTDFGVARDITRHSLTAMTVAGQQLGTPAYMAPEVLTGVRGDIDWKLADQWSLGAVFYEAATGVRVRDSLMDREVPKPIQRPELAELGRVIDAMLRRDPDERYSSLIRVVTDLERIERGEPARPPRARPLRRWWRRYRDDVARAIGVGMLMGLGLGLVALGWQWRSEVRAVATWDSTQQRLSALEAEGRFDEADVAFDAFAGLPEVSGSSVLSEAYRQRASTVLERDDDLALKLAARAWMRAPTPEARGLALQQLAAVLHHRGDWPRLSQLSPWVRGDALVPGGSVNRDMALFNGDLRAAADHAEQPAVRELLADWARSGGPRWPGKGLAPDAASDDVVAIGGVDGWFLDRTHRAVQRRVDGQLQSIVTFPAAVWTAEVLDGRLFVATAGTDRRLYEVDPDSGVLTVVGPDLRARGSYILGLDQLDFDGDGVSDLVAALGPPAGFELRVYDGGPDGVVLARARIGFADSLAVLDGRTIVVSTVHEHEGPGIFGVDTPYGPPEGLHRFDVIDGRLVGPVHLPGPFQIDGKRVQYRNLEVHDLDRDGRDDLVFVAAADGEILGKGALLQGEDGQLHGFVLPDASVEPLAAAPPLDWPSIVSWLDLDAGPEPGTGGAPLHPVDLERAARSPVALEVLATVADPHVSRVNRARGSLDLDSVTEGPTVARLQLERLSGPVGFRVSGEAQVIEWGSGLEVFLERDGQRVLGASLLGRGVGGGYFAEIGFGGAGGSTSPLPTSNTHLPVEMSVWGSPDTGRAQCSGRLGGQGGDLPLDMPVGEGEAWALVLRPLQEDYTGALLRLAVTSLELYGLEPVASVRPAPAAAHPLAEMRLSPKEAFVEASQRTDAETALAELLEAWTIPLFNHRADVEFARLMTLLSAELDGDLGTSPPGRVLLLARARRAFEDGHPERARKDWERVARAALAGADAQEAHEGLVRLALAEGRRDDALKHARSAISTADSPLLAADRLALMPEVAALADEEGWTLLLEGSLGR